MSEPDVRGHGPVRRQLRGLRHGVLADRPDQSLLDPVGQDPGAQDVRPLLLPAVRSEVRRVHEGLARHAGTAATVGRQQGARVAERQRRPGARRLGHLARRAVFRHSDSGRARQILLCVARCADRLSRLAQELLRQRQGAREGRAAQLRRVPGRAGNGADSLHRQGHHLLSHAVLAGDAEVRRPQSARSRLRARLHHARRREDVEVARHRPEPAALSRARPESGMAAVLHRGQVERERRGHGVQSRRLRGARQQRPGRQVRQHREPHRGLHQQALRRPARQRSVRQPAARRGARSVEQNRCVLRAARVRQGDARNHGSRGPRQCLHRATGAVGSGEGSAERCKAEAGVHGQPERVPTADALPEAGHAEARRVRRELSCGFRRCNGRTHRACWKIMPSARTSIS